MRVHRLVFCVFECNMLADWIYGIVYVHVHCSFRGSRTHKANVMLEVY